MKTQFNTRHFAPSPELSDFVRDQLNHLETAFPDLLKSGSVTITREDSRFLAEARLHGRRLNVVGKGNGKEPEIAFSYAFDHVEGQIRRIHDKKSGHRPSRKAPAGFPREAQEDF